MPTCAEADTASLVSYDGDTDLDNLIDIESDYDVVEVEVDDAFEVPPSQPLDDVFCREPLLQRNQKQ